MGKNKIVAVLKRWLVGLLLMVGGAGFFVPSAQAGSVPPDPAFNANRLTEDERFTAKDAMTVASIQAFLEVTPYGTRSCLANYSEGGSSAAQIIYDYTRGTQDPPAVGEFTFNPRDIALHPGVILVTLQKEMGLISAPDAVCPNDRMRIAMGFGCPDSGGCGESYYGFAKQVLYGAWQLDRNFDCADRSDSACDPYFVGNTRDLPNSTDFYDVSSPQSVTFSNRSTAALYRYTPHAFNGNYNFWKFFRNWFPTYSARFVSQGSQTIVGSPYYPTVAAGQTVKLSVALQNTGTATWQRGIVNLGTDRGRDRIPSFIREGGQPSGWLTPNRVEMKESSVAPGGTGTFEFWYKVPETMAPGTYREYFRPVADGFAWLEDWGIFWDIIVVSRADAYHARFYTQSGYPTLRRNESYQFEVKLENTGLTTWQQGTVNLGTDRPRDRIPGFIREGGNPSGWLNHDRVRLVEESVPPRGVGTFRFWYKVPPDKEFGTFREYFRPVADGITWMDDWGIYWDVTVVP